MDDGQVLVAEPGFHSDPQSNVGFEVLVVHFFDFRSEEVEQQPKNVWRWALFQRGGSASPL